MNPYRFLFRLVPWRVKDVARRKLRDMVLTVAREEAFLVSRDIARAEARLIIGDLTEEIPAAAEHAPLIPTGEGGAGSDIVRRFRYGRLLDRMMGPEPWAIDGFEILGDQVQIRGWALAPGSDLSMVGFCLNGQPFDQIVYSGERPDIARMFWFRPLARSSAFSCMTQCLQLPRSSPLVFSFVRRDTVVPVCAEHLYYYPPRPDDLPLPDAIRRVRSHGADSESSFRLEGYSAFCKLEHALSRFAAKTFRDCSNILDWGCGCGRIARYFGGIPGLAFTGVDIDADNVGWCQDHLPFGEFETVGTTPPTTVPDCSFDLVIGISVFTHLREQDQLLWLRELHRLSKPGAILLLTVLGDAGVARGRLTLDEFLEFQQRGISEARHNPDIDRVVADSGYYRNTFHSYRYLREIWGRFFHFRGYVPAYIGNMQDLAILQRP